MHVRFLLFTATVLSLVSCGPPSRQQARDQAVSHACDRYNTCGQIGSGKTYADRDQCELQQRAFWDNLWSTGSCEDRIHRTSLDTCLTAIDITDCSNIVDLANTVLVKCPASAVCAGPGGSGGPVDSGR